MASHYGGGNGGYDDRGRRDRDRGQGGRGHGHPNNNERYDGNQYGGRDRSFDRQDDRDYRGRHEGESRHSHGGGYERSEYQGGRDEADFSSRCDGGGGSGGYGDWGRDRGGEGQRRPNYSGGYGGNHYNDRSRDTSRRDDQDYRGGGHRLVGEGIRNLGGDQGGRDAGGREVIAMPSRYEGVGRSERYDDRGQGQDRGGGGYDRPRNSGYHDDRSRSRDRQDNRDYHHRGGEGAGRGPDGGHGGLDDGGRNFAEVSSRYGGGGGGGSGGYDDRGRGRHRGEEGYGRHPTYSGHHHDRSRSRDRRDYRDFCDNRGGGGGRGRGGRGGRGPDRGGGGRAGGRGRSLLAPRPTTAMVNANYYPLIHGPSEDIGAAVNECVQYSVEMLDAMILREDDPENPGSRRIRRGEEGNPIIIPKAEGDEYRRLDLGKMAKSGNRLQYRIVDQLQRDERERLEGLDQSDSAKRLYLAYDGAMTVYAPQRLFDPPVADGQGGAQGAVDAGPAPLIAARSGSGEGGSYGPADNHAPRQERGGPDRNLYDSPYGSDRSGPGIYHTRVTKDCDADDSDANQMKKSWFIVVLTEVGFIQLSALQGHAATQVQGQNQVVQAQNQALAQCVNTILRSARLSSGQFVSLRGSPHTFFKSIPGNTSMMGQTLTAIYQGKDVRRSKSGTVMPSVGIRQALKFCLSGNVFEDTGGGLGVTPLLLMGSKVGFFDRKRTYTPNPNVEPELIPIVIGERGTIAGVPVEERTQVEDALRKKRFDVRYTTNNKETIQRWRKERLSEDEIQRRTKVVRALDAPIKPDKKRENESGIIWDPASYTFEMKPRRRRGEGEEGNDNEATVLTIEQYFKRVYNIDLRFPKHPLVHLGNGAYFPVEFLYQSFGVAKGTNLGDAVLAEKDENAGPKSIENLRAVFSAMPVEFFHFIQHGFNLRIGDTPKQLKATVLLQPTLRFRGGREAKIRNGSWNLHQIEFAIPSCMNSFAIIDLSRDESGINYFKTQLSVCKKHGMLLPDDVLRCSEIANKIIVRRSLHNSDTAQVLRDAFAEATSKSRDFFVHDTSGHFKSTHSWFKSLAYDPAGVGSTECLVIPNPQPDNSQAVDLILPASVFEPTHSFVVNGSKLDARLMVRVVGVSNSVDPFDTRSHGNQFQFRERTNQDVGPWKPAEFGQYVYKMIGDDTIVTADQVGNPEPKHRTENSMVEGPSIVFVYIPTEDKEVYSIIKQLSTFHFGIPSQVISGGKFQSQRTPSRANQYCSNVALKLSAKLSNTWNGGRAWNSAHTLPDGGIIDELPWLTEVPTMIMGISMSHGQGQSNISIVVAHVCLDNFGFQMASELKIQNKSDIISNTVMKQITTALATAYEQYTRQKIQRAVVFRDGMSDGSFPAAANEIASMRQAFHEIRAVDPNFSCPNAVVCAGRGCVYCTPAISYGSCQNDHGILLVPSRNDEGVVGMGKGNAPFNVHSGTCIDHTIIEGMHRLEIDQPTEERDGVVLFARDPASSYDFLLTAQGGLKGTSKPVYYRWLLNENSVYKRSEKTTPLRREVLEILVYHMCFQYSTATKAVRSVPVVHYSRALAKQAMNWANDLIQRGCITSRNQNNAGETVYLRSTGDRGENPELLPAFAPFDPNNPGVKRLPFRPGGMLCAMAKRT